MALLLVLIAAHVIAAAIFHELTKPSLSLSLSLSLPFTLALSVFNLHNLLWR
jgi:hypothetical protein